MTHRALLALADGTLFHGRAIGASGTSVGEVVFNTAMTGYQEILTDPSYARQIVTLTYPHIGNTGCNDIDIESTAPAAAGLVIRDYPRLASSWRQSQSLADYLQASGIIGLADIDTRKLTRLLREQGAQNGCLMAGRNIDEDQAVEMAGQFPGLQGMDLAREVTVAAPYDWHQGEYDLDQQQYRETDSQWHVVAYDFGIKRAILRMLAARGCRLTVVPATTPASDALALKPDGIFLSNGPGDPEPCGYAIDAIREFIRRRIPLFGICLGHQLLGLATGARTVKMKFGHHGANHPVQQLDNGAVMISSQNHGFAIDEDSLPANVSATHRSLFDGSLQGIVLNNAPAFGFQGHPEASPGPRDLTVLFDQFVDSIKQHQASGQAREEVA